MERVLWKEVIFVFVVDDVGDDVVVGKLNLSVAKQLLVARLNCKTEVKRAKDLFSVLMSSLFQEIYFSSLETLLVSKIGEVHQEMKNQKSISAWSDHSK